MSDQVSLENPVNAPSAIPASDPAPAPEAVTLPEGGSEKYLNKQTGEYNWQAHNRELQYQLDQARNKAAGKPGSDFITEPEAAPSADSKTAFRDFTSAVAAGDREASRAAAKALLDAGIPEDVLTSHVETVRLQQAARTQDTLRTVGVEVFGEEGAGRGEEAIQHLKSWAQNNLSPEDYGMYQEAVSGPHWKIAVRQLAQMAGKPGTVDMGSTPGQGHGGAAFANQAELAAAIQDPRYSKDPAYRQQVMQRAAASKF